MINLFKKQFWVKESPFLKIMKAKAKCKANAKATLKSNFFTLYTILPHFDLISVLINITDFKFKGGNENILIFLEMQLSGVINLNTYVSLLRPLHKAQYNTLLIVVILK